MFLDVHKTTVILYKNEYIRKGWELPKIKYIRLYIAFLDLKAVE